MNEDQNLKLKKMGFVLLTVLSVFVAVEIIAQVKGLAYIGKSDQYTATISFSGKGEVVAVPDIATFTYGVSEDAKTVAEAQTTATDKANKILAFLKENGVEDKDIKTVDYNVSPKYEYQTETLSAPAVYGGATNYYVPTRGKQVITGYTVTQTTEVKVRKTSEAGKLLTGVGGLGASNVSSLNFSVDKYDELVEEARAKAIADAKTQAKALAKDLGVRLVRITSFYDQGNYPPVYYAKAGMAYGMGGDAEMATAPAPQLPAGENKIVSNVSITYEIR